ncbi:hypothetical protein [Chroococcidiopsis sp. TS-821]
MRIRTLNKLSAFVRSRLCNCQHRFDVLKLIEAICKLSFYSRYSVE